jgi:FtsZ-binding cell division protein ZapB
MVGKAPDSVDGVTRAAYSGGMISEFQELSDKIDQLAEMTAALRRENAQLRQANAALVVENMGYQRRLSEASGRVEALLEKIPSLDGDAEDDDLPEKEDVR